VSIPKYRADSIEKWKLAEKLTLESQDVVIMRTSFSDDNSLFVGFKAGKNGEKHGQLDVGSFVFDALGQRWVEDLGSDTYNAPYFEFGTSASPGPRWSFYRAKAEANNTIVFGNRSRPQQDPWGKGEVLKVADTNPQSTSSGEMFVVSDLTGAYYERNETIRRVMRGLRLNKRDKWLLVQDVAVAQAGKTESMWSTLHFGSYLEVTVAQNGRQAVIQNPHTGRALLVVVRSPDTTLVRDTDLVGTAPHPTQSSNLKLQRLRIVVSAKEVPWSAVYLVPLESIPSNGVWPSLPSLPGVSDMREW
jgi:hypothetical protein